MYDSSNACGEAILAGETNICEQEPIIAKLPFKSLSEFANFVPWDTKISQEKYVLTVPQVGAGQRP